MKTSKLNDIETTFEIPTTPIELRQLADRIEHLEQSAFPGQTIRVKLNHQIAATYKVVNVPHFSAQRVLDLNTSTETLQS